MNTSLHIQPFCTRAALLFVTTACLVLYSWSSAHAETSATEGTNASSPLALLPQVYIPVVENNVALRTAAGSTDAEPTDTEPTDTESCSLDDEAAELMALILSHSAQERPTLQCDPILSQVATERAQDMATRGYFDHVSPEGIGPNYLVRAANFPLSNNYSSSTDANNLESIAGGTQTAQQTFDLFVGSSGHRKHILGESSFYRAQGHIGVGMVDDPDSPFRFYWVVLIAEAEAE